jgi:hypothetical protein
MGALAKHIDVAEATVQSWRRNLGRSEKKANKEAGTALSVFVWDAANERYDVPGEMVKAISATDFGS